MPRSLSNHLLGCGSGPLLCALWICCCCLLASEATKLVQLQLVFRHGVRNPLAVLPNDPYSERYKDSLGQLTPAGVTQMHELGQFVRTYYREQRLLPERFEPDQVWAYSTNTPRTLASGRAFLSGLFPPGTANDSQSAPPLKPMPLHSSPTEADPMKPTSFTCPARDRLINAAMSGATFHAIEAETRDLLTHMAGATGKPDFDLRDAWTLGSSAQMWLGMGLALPDWLSSGDYGRLQWLRVGKYDMMFGSRAVQRFCGGPLLSRMLDGARARLTPGGRTRLLIYSGHDSTIAALTSALGFAAADLGSAPPPAALLAMEVYSDATVRFAYRNSTVYRPRLLRPPGCGGKDADDCLLDRLAVANADILNGVNLPGECVAVYGGYVSVSVSASGPLVLLLGLGLAGVCLAIACLAVRRLRRGGFGHRRGQNGGGGVKLSSSNVGGNYAYTALATGPEDQDGDDEEVVIMVANNGVAM